MKIAVVIALVMGILFFLPKVITIYRNTFYPDILTRGVFTSSWELFIAQYFPLFILAIPIIFVIIAVRHRQSGN